VKEVCSSADLDAADLDAAVVPTLMAATRVRAWVVAVAERPCRRRPSRHVKIYPDAAHGFLFQHHADFAATSTLPHGVTGAAWRGLAAVGVHVRQLLGAEGLRGCFGGAAGHASPAGVCS
jgi:hypothetical protein